MGFGGEEGNFYFPQNPSDRISEIGSSGVLQTERSRDAEGVRGKRVKTKQNSPFDLWARHNGMHAG